MKNGRPQGVHPLALIGHPPSHFQGYDDTFWPIIDPTAYIDAFTSVDCGTERMTYIGQDTYIMQRCFIGHDTWIASNCDIADSVVIGGFCDIGHHVRIGLNATILPYRKIGDGARIGAGSVVVAKEIPRYECWAGNPAKKIHHLCWICRIKTDRVFQDWGMSIAVCDQCSDDMKAMWDKCWDDIT